MAKISDNFNPSFVRWPIQNNRTALTPIALPIVLCVPFSKDPDSGALIQNSQVTDLKFYIADAPSKTGVAGFEHAGLFIPDLERFVRPISTQELLDVRLDLTGLQFFDQVTGEVKDFTQAVDGDFFEYTLLRGVVEHTGARDRIEYLPHAEYYDLSPFTIATAELKPYGIYDFVWQCNYFRRIETSTGQLSCIDTTNKRIARFNLTMNHPGEIHRMMIEQTPSIYFEGKPLEDDNLVKFYRPFADALQDQFDEQSLINGINFIEKIPAQFIPYLAYLLGWDIPFFPGATDKIRRAVLRNGRRLQQLKGSRRVIRELFELFGFTIDIVNLWYRRDGKQFVGPEEPQIGFPEQEIDIQTVCQTEVLLADFAEDGYGNLEIPLLFRPSGDMTINAWLVEEGSAAEAQLQSLMDILDVDPEGLMGTICPTTIEGFAISQPLQDTVTASALGESTLLLTQKFGVSDELRSGDAPLSKYGLKYDFDRNIIKMTFDHHIKFDGMKLYTFATYVREKIVVPPELTDLRSNRFDIKVLFDRTTGEPPGSHLLDFLLDFIFKLKAFHSILRKIIFTIPITDVYAVTSYCLPRDSEELQTLPPVIPTDQQGCSEETFNRGFKESDFALRDEILAGLKREHEAWKALDDTHQIPPELAPLLESLSRIQPNLPSDGDCQFTQYGQERVIADNPDTSEDDSSVDLDHNDDVREKLCDEPQNAIANCFIGRVKQPLEIDRVLLLKEIIRCRPCGLMTGKGFYYNNPIRPYQLGPNEVDTTLLTNLGKSRLTDDLIRVNAYPERIHFTNGLGLTENDIFTNDRVAIRRPSLDIDRDNMFMPGHRFLIMQYLENDFTHTTYTFRPWDDMFNPTQCPEEIPVGAPTLDDLEFSLTIGSDGDQILVFNQIQYVVFGNGLIPDISTLGEHDDRSFFVTHSLFSTSNDNPAIDHQTEGATIFTDLTTVCFSDGYSPLYQSANRNCGCDNPSESFVSGSTNLSGADFIDGYPAEFGIFDADMSQFDYPRGQSDDVDLTELLGMPSGLGTGGSGTEPTDLLFKCGSGIRVAETDPGFRFVRPLRIDCGCAIFECPPVCDLGSTGGSEVSAVSGSETPFVPHVDRCHIDLFRNQDGSLDTNCDRVEAIPSLVIEDIISACSTRMALFPFSAPDTAMPITNMFTFDPSLLSPSDDFFFVDSYGIIYEGFFTINGNILDITFTVRDPRVWNEEPQGFVTADHKVFRRGTVTTCTQTIELNTEPNDINIISSTCAQTISTFQTTFGCGDRIPQDPFAFHISCGILDEVDFEVSCGPAWEGDGNTIWCNITEGSTGGSDGDAIVINDGNQCLYWINVWDIGDNDIITVCPNVGSGSGSGSGSNPSGCGDLTLELLDQELVQPGVFQCEYEAFTIPGFVFATGGTAPYVYSVGSGLLPGGATFNADGSLSGTLTFNGPPSGGTFTITVTDANGCTANLSICWSEGDDSDCHECEDSICQSVYFSSDPGCEHF